MRILAIESSCDETSAAVVEKNGSNRVRVLSNITASSVVFHAKTGGIIPEKAAREQVKWMIPIIIQSLLESENEEPRSIRKQFELANQILKNELLRSRATEYPSESSFAASSPLAVLRGIRTQNNTIDALAVTVGPGLIGSLLVGVETAKTFSYIFNKPIIPVNHLLGHIYANFIANDKRLMTNDKLITFPLIALIASGGHTDLLLFKSHTTFQWLGGTRDDAAGEAMDKIARLLHLPYPGGPEIEKKAQLGIPGRFRFKSPMLESDDFDFSFSGLKTEVGRFVHKYLQDVPSNGNINERVKNDVCLAVQKAIIDVLVVKTIKAAQKYNVSTILLGGGVAANQSLRNELIQKTNDQRPMTKIFSPEKIFCTDNAAMIGAYALFHPKPVPWHLLTANPELYFS